eukprot:CFRG4583T1
MDPIKPSSVHHQNQSMYFNRKIQFGTLNCSLTLGILRLVKSGILQATSVIFKKMQCNKYMKGVLVSTFVS